MKKFFSSLFRSKKQNVTEEELSLSDMMAFLETKVFPCSECGHFFQLDQPTPLSIAPCSQCGSGNFVPKKLGPFWLYRFCGDGGMGRVYKATCSLVPDTEFAVKILPEEFRDNSASIEGLRREAEVTSLFNSHPNSVNVVEFDREKDIFYMATEFIEGKQLDELIGVKGLSEQEVVNYSLQLVEMIEFIYSKGYLYRDLKPQNIIIAKDGHLTLLDYGICLPKGTAAHQVFEEVDGSAHYVPPERLTGDGEDIRSEIYSIGMLLYHMLTGQTYFKGDSLQEIAEQHVNSPRRENLFKEMPLINDELVKLIVKMTDEKKRCRTKTLSEVKAVLNYLWKQHQAEGKYASQEVGD